MDEKIKVTDKRMFDSEGELREGYRRGGDQDQTAGSSAEVENGHKPARASSPEATQPSGLPEPELMDLIGLLAQPIAMFLGDAPLPDGGSAENLALARYHIDLLELLQTRTKGNLDPQEEQVLADLLYQLRMRYVEKVG